MLGAVQDVEGLARRALFNFLGTASNLRAIEALRTYVVTEVDVKLAYYETLPGHCGDWVNEVKRTSIESILECLPPGWSQYEKQFLPELERTVTEHLAARAKPRETNINEPPQTARQKMRDSYKEKFPDAKNLDICWAAKQHYREWKRWLKYEIKDGSLPDRAFRKVLLSGKSLAEQRKEPRPPKWQ
jgi:hypothetical protein